ncbi:MAG: A/G-specific adenine glycosylase [Maribacter sp.]|nr:A/G-specific adenine glycosylase [Maribacter sp.]MBT8313853.1 A/G-specific adenine glycosylase [Maribacter sp.]
MIFSQKILIWYAKNKRTLPWRRTKDPYRIWLSEIMLQQTRVAQGLPYYLRFTEQFPTVQDLANAPEERILKLWQGLGYYSRARNLHATAKTIVTDYEGKFPDTYKELKKLKGVGDYTASAIASICFDQPEPVVDGNVFRVLSRYYGVGIPINSGKGADYFKKLAREVMDVDNIRDYNQAIMEFGAIQCAPKNPNCGICPLKNGCVALQKNKVNQLPVKLNKTKVRNRYFNYLVVIDSSNKTVLKQREGKGIWQNLWEFPLLETKKKIDQKELEAGIKEVISINDSPEIYQFNTNDIIHKLSHQHLHTKFWILKTDTALKEGIQLGTLDQYPVPVLIADFIKTFKI